MTIKAGWKVTTLENICDFVRGPFGGSLKKSCFKSWGYAVYEQQHAIRCQFKDIRYYVDQDKFDEMSRFELVPGDLIMSCSGTMGKVAIVPRNIERGIINQALLKLTVKEELLVKFLCYWMESPNFQMKLGRHSKGVAIKNVASVKVLKEIDLGLPPLPEQKSIVAILDEAFSGIRQAVAHAEKNLANAREFFESTLNNVFTRKGEGWVEKKLGDVCSIKHGFAFKSQFFSTEGDYVLLTPGSFYENGGFRFQGKKTKYYTGAIPTAYILDEGAFLIAMTEQAVGLLGSPLIVPRSNSFLHNQRLGLLQVNDGMTWNNDFFHHQFNTQCFRSAVQSTASGVKVRHTSPKKLEAIPISFPQKLSAQEEISSVLNEMKAKTQRLETIYKQKLTALTELKQSILQKAFTGQLTGNNG